MRINEQKKLKLDLNAIVKNLTLAWNSSQICALTYFFIMMILIKKNDNKLILNCTPYILLIT